MFIIFLINLKKENFKLFENKYLPTSCRAVFSTLEKKIPGSWKIECTDNNLAIVMTKDIKDIPKKLLLPTLYRELANDLVYISKNSPSENLERTNTVRIKMLHPNMEINAVTLGKDLAKLKNLNHGPFIAEHLKSTVHVKETPK